MSTKQWQESTPPAGTAAARKSTRRRKPRKRTSLPGRLPRPACSAGQRLPEAALPGPDPVVTPVSSASAPPFLRPRQQQAGVFPLLGSPAYTQPPVHLPAPYGPSAAQNVPTTVVRRHLTLQEPCGRRAPLPQAAGPPPSLQGEPFPEQKCAATTSRACLDSAAGTVGPATKRGQETRERRAGEGRRKSEAGANEGEGSRALLAPVGRPAKL